MIVAKFGGTSVGTAQRIRNVAKLINDGVPKVIVLSAMSGTTNVLMGIADCLHNENVTDGLVKIKALQSQYTNVVEELYETNNGKRLGGEIVQSHFAQIHSLANTPFSSYDSKKMVAYGELLSTVLFHLLLTELGIASTLLQALDFMRVDEHGEPDMNATSTLLQKQINEYSGHHTFVTQGYICRNAYGEVDNLKRGGSDYTATILGALLNADEVQIWTDIDGMHNNDPRYVTPTKPIAELTFDEAAELAYFGAKILHPTCVLPAQRKNIPVRLLNTMEPEKPGTVIKQTTSFGGVKAVACKDGITAVKIKSSRMLLAFGFLRAVFEVFERFRTPIDAITTSEVAVSLTIDDASRLDEIVTELNMLGTVELDRDLALICIVGDFGPEKQGYALKIFEALRDIPVRMISYGGSERNVTVVIKAELKRAALTALNQHLFEFTT